jgi:hypothetical protein
MWRSRVSDAPQTLPVPVVGLTPAQRALAAAPVERTPVSAIEQRLFQLFELVERFIHPDDCGRYGALLQDIAEDQTYDEITYLGLIRAPASHTASWLAAEGSLTASLLRQWGIWCEVRDGGKLPGTERPLWPDLLDDRDVTDENVLRGLIHYALPRGWAHYVQRPGDGWAVALGGHESSTLLSYGAKALLLLQQRDIILDGQLMHLLLPNEGLHQTKQTPLAQTVFAVERGARMFCAAVGV